jgi:serine/threonine protein kinase
MKNLTHLGSGGQADVYKCVLTAGPDSIVCVAKTVKVFNNQDIAVSKFREMYKEFRIGCCLSHPGIVDYKYFIRQDSQRLGPKEQEFVILIELCEGGNLEQYLAQMPKKREVNIQQVREIVR